MVVDKLRFCLNFWSLERMNTWNLEISDAELPDTLNQ